MLSSADIDGYFTNHSLRRSGCTRLFQAGIDRKIVKEISGHRSDAVDKYQITSDIQKQQVSNVISKVLKVPHLVEQKTDFCEESNEIKTKDKIENVEVLSTFSLDGKERCSCKKTYKQTSNNLGEMIESILKANAKDGKKARVKIEIEIDTV